MIETTVSITCSTMYQMHKHWSFALNKMSDWLLFPSLINPDVLWSDDNALPGTCLFYHCWHHFNYYELLWRVNLICWAWAASNACPIFTLISPLQKMHWQILMFVQGCMLFVVPTLCSFKPHNCLIQKNTFLKPTKSHPSLNIHPLFSWWGALGSIALQINILTFSIQISFLL